MLPGTLAADLELMGRGGDSVITYRARLRVPVAPSVIGGCGVCFVFLAEMTINSAPDPLVTWTVPVFNGRATDRRWSDTRGGTKKESAEGGGARRYETRVEEDIYPSPLPSPPDARALSRFTVLRRGDIPCPGTATVCVAVREEKRELQRRGVAEGDKRNSTYLAYLSAYVLPELVETSRQGHLVTHSHSILARQFVKNRVPDVIALKQIPPSIIRPPARLHSAHQALS